MKARTIEFTKTELKIIKLICKQFSNEQIADKLGFKKRTIEDYRAKIIKKIKAKNSIGIAMYAVKHGLFQP